MDRYARQTVLKEIGPEGQRRLSESTAVIVGVGATGSLAAELLARAGVNVRFIDRDFIELTNLQRQCLFDEHDVGKPKALAAEQRLRQINTDVRVEGVADDVTPQNIAKLLGRPNVVLDCTDNFATRFLLNDYCLKARTPWIYAGAVGTRGVVLPIGPRGRPCLRCLIRNEPDALETCDTVGVLNAASATVAALQAGEAIKTLLGEKAYEMLDVDLWTGAFIKTRVPARKDCVACAKKNYEYLKKGAGVVALCGRGAYHVRLGKRLSLEEINRRATKTMETQLFAGVLHLYPDGKRISLFENGRAIVEASSAAEARSRLARFVGV